MRPRFFVPVLALLLSGSLALAEPQDEGLPLDFAPRPAAQVEAAAPRAPVDDPTEQACPPPEEASGASRAIAKLFGLFGVEVPLPPNPEDEGALDGLPSAERDDRLEHARALVEAQGSADAADAELVAGELALLPVPVLAFLEESGVTVAVVRGSVTDVREDLRGVRPRGWPPGATWDRVPGLYEPENKRVIVATRGHGTSHGAYVPRRGDGHGSVNLVLHETAHAIDKNGPDGQRSSEAAYRAAREADFSRLGGYERQPGQAGLEETYAESLARFYGGDPRLADRWPALYGYWLSDPLGAGG